MTDKQMHELLEKFANDNVLASNIEVKIDLNHKSFMAKDGTVGANYEDCNLLASIIQGAEHFLWWARRNGYYVKKGIKKG